MVTTNTWDIVNDLFKASDRYLIGYDTLLKRLVDQPYQAQNYPPFNIIRTGEDYKIEIAVAGFGINDIVVTRDGDKLIISGEKEKEERDYIFNGISSKSFQRSFYLSNTIEIVDVTLKNGILTIHLNNKIPEEMKPKKIAISAG